MKNMLSRLARTWAAIATVAMITTCSLPATAIAHDGSADAVSDHRIIRVGWPIQPGLSESDGHGSYSGYTYDYLEQVAQYTGWSYQFVEAEGSINEQLTTLLAMMEAGEIDIMGAMAYNDSLAQQFDYATNSYGAATSALLAASSNDNLTETNIYLQEKLHVAFNGPSPKSHSGAQMFCDANGIQMEAVECDSIQAQIDAVLSGKADVLTGVDISPIEGMHVVASMASNPFYFAASKGEKDIVASLNEAIVQIDRAEPMLQHDLYAKHFDTHQGSTGLAKDMRAFVAQAGTIRVGYLTGAAPVQDVDEKTGLPVGASKAVLDYIAEYTGLSLEIVPVTGELNWDEAIQEFDLDAIAGIVHDFPFAHQHNLSLSTPYLSSYQWIVTRSGVNASNLAEGRAALIRSATCEEADRENALVCNTLEDCVEAVDTGRADYTYADGYSGPYFENMESYPNVTAYMNPNEENSICFAFASSSDHRLLRVFNEAIRQMPVGIVNDSIYAEALQENQMTFVQFAEAHVKEIALISLVVASVIIALSIGYARNRAKALEITRAEKDRLKAVAERDGLTGLLGVGAFKNEAQTLVDRNNVGAFVVVDIDDFKVVNDTYGHKAGDESLCLLASMMKETFREDDLVCRFGGDEFAVCLAGMVSADALEKRCRELLVRVATASAEAGPPFSVSIGAVRARGGESYLELYDQADKAMYEAKRAGKSGFFVL